MKKAYTTPELARFGSISELTLAGKTNPGYDGIEYEDGVFGSVCQDDGGDPVTCS